MLRRYRYRAYPTPAQKQLLARFFGCARVVFNDVVELRRHQHATGMPFESDSALQSKVTTQAKMRPERSWLREAPAVVLQQSAQDALRGYRNFFDSTSRKRKGGIVSPPRFKSRRAGRQSVRLTRNHFSVLETPGGKGRVRISKVGRVRFELSRPLPSDPSSVTVIREADGRYYVSFVVDVPAIPSTPPAHPGRAIGIDLGLTHFAIIAANDGTREKIENPRHLRASERKLARAQRALSRKEKGSANREKARVRVAAVHRKVRETRLDHHHKLARRLVHENQVIAVEGLAISGLARSGAKGSRGRGLRRSMHDAGWGTFLRVLAEKAVEHDRQFITIGRFEPTSQVCSICGVQDGPKPLSVRAWKCTSCDSVLDRDYNAALNIMLAAGLAESLNACGGDVRRELALADPDEAGTHRTELMLA